MTLYTENYTKATIAWLGRKTYQDIIDIKDFLLSVRLYMEKSLTKYRHQLSDDEIKNCEQSRDIIDRVIAEAIANR